MAKPANTIRMIETNGGHTTLNSNLVVLLPVYPQTYQVLANGQDAKGNPEVH